MKENMALQCPKVMELGQLMKDKLVNVSCKFEMYIFKIAQVINENVCIAFLYVLSIQGCTAGEDGWRLEISDLKSKGIALSM